MRKSGGKILGAGLVAGLVLLAVGTLPVFAGEKSAPQAEPTEPEHLAVVADGAWTVQPL